MSEQPAFLQVEAVTKRFGSVSALDCVDLAIGSGEFFALLGPSGCGKTTLLRTIGGFETPDSGRVLIEGADVTFAPPERRPTNMVFQSYAIFPHLNVFANVAYGLRKSGLDPAALRKRVLDALALTRLEGLDARKSDELSGGQRQRVALARALVRRPKVLLLDEPLGALDKRLREAMQLELLQLQRQVGITFLFVTHDQDEALSMADRVAVMSTGRVLQIATPRSLYESPVNREAADFVGTMNFFEAEIVSRDTDRCVVHAGPIGTAILAMAPDFAKQGAKVLLALRPEKISIAGDGALKGTVSATNYLGEHTHLRVAIEGLPHSVAVSVQNGAPGSETPAPGATVALTWNPQSFVVLER